MNDGYWLGYVITWLILFVCAWIYAIATYGFLLGVTLGAVAAAIFASVVALFWPIVALGALWIAWMAFSK